VAAEARVLVGETAVVTGGARGIGRATAQALLAVGMKVAIGDIDGDLARQTAAELSPTKAYGGDLDVTDRASFTAFLQATEQALGPIDVLINNAGIMPLNRFTDEDDDTARRIIDINVHGVILGTKLALERMLPRDHGHIVNIASQAGKIGTPGGATYSASKHAVIGLTESVRGEMRLLGAKVKLSYVMPSVVATELGSGLSSTPGVKKLTPTDVAGAILEALQHGTVDVWVPKSVRPLYAFSQVVPRRVSEGMARVMKADRVLFAPDEQVRAGYELRAAHSEPGLPPAPSTPQIAAGATVETVEEPARTPTG
jgi:NAD(P)-dependent dehydrogenase (short-subunit alcohol dehydrogenase family)